VIDNNDISMTSDNIDVENGGVGTFDLDFVTIASPHDLEGDMEKTEFGLGFDQRIPTSLHQSESATVSDWAIPNDGSRSISDFPYSNGNATNLSKKGKKRKNHRYSDNRSLSMKGTETFTNTEVDGVDPDMPNCDDIDDIEIDKRLQSKRQRGPSSAARSDAVHSYTAYPVSSKRPLDPNVCKGGSQGERWNVPGYDLTYVDNLQIVRSSLGMGMTVPSRLTAIPPMWMLQSPPPRKSQRATNPH